MAEHCHHVQLRQVASARGCEQLPQALSAAARAARCHRLVGAHAVSGPKQAPFCSRVLGASLLSQSPTPNEPTGVQNSYHALCQQPRICSERQRQRGETWARRGASAWCAAQHNIPMFCACTMQNACKSCSGTLCIDHVTGAASSTILSLTICMTVSWLGAAADMGTTPDARLLQAQQGQQPQVANGMSQPQYFAQQQLPTAAMSGHSPHAVHGSGMPGQQSAGAQPPMSGHVVHAAQAYGGQGIVRGGYR
jgi:hypothetical protein